MENKRCDGIGGNLRWDGGKEDSSTGAFTVAYICLSSSVGGNSSLARLRMAGTVAGAVFSSFALRLTFVRDIRALLLLSLCVAVRRNESSKTLEDFYCGLHTHARAMDKSLHEVLMDRSMHAGAVDKTARTREALKSSQRRPSRNLRMTRRVS